MGSDELPCRPSFKSGAHHLISLIHPENWPCNRRNEASGVANTRDLCYCSVIGSVYRAGDIPPPLPGYLNLFRIGDVQKFS